jgi:hypothetical protein
VYAIDTTRLANGVHTIAWSVVDNQPSPNAAGIGSRYFNVANGAMTEAVASATTSPMMMASSANDASDRADVREDVKAVAVAPATVLARRGFSMKAPFRRIAPDREGRVTLEGEELDRFEMKLQAGERVTGHLRSGEDVLPLPIGSRLDPATGTFTWQPGVGFVGTYDFSFVRWIAGTAVSSQDVRIVLNPKTSGRVGTQVVIDTPTRQDTVGGPFLVAGWAVDLDADTGNGVDTLHVWAYPVDGGDPVFLGAADRGGIRPDVAALHGERFKDAGYGLIVKGLAPGAYNLAVFAWSNAMGDWAPARTVPVNVR